MTLSIRARRWLRADQERRAAERRAAQQAAQAAADAHHAQWLDRVRTAAFLGVSVHQLKRLMAAGRGPVCVKHGASRQAPVRWHIDQLISWKTGGQGRS